MSESYTQPLARLIGEFQKLPGVGPKSAQRLAFHMLRQSTEDVQCFSDALTGAKESIKECSICSNWSAHSPCELCLQPDRKASQIAVVSMPQDLFAIERTQEFKGHYHVLHGLISPMDNITPEDLRFRALLERLKACVPDSDTPVVQEVILALPPSIEGDTTSLYLSRIIKPAGIKLTRIAFGLPVGGDLEYADQMTLAKALEGRQEI